jgi:RNA polymerase sigma-70 factor (ECF subfamily)
MPALNPHPDDAAVTSTRDDVARAAGGDVAAFERLYRGHVARVHSLARRMAGPAQADELTQDVFVRTWQKLGTFRGDAAFSTWLHRLAVNVIIERFRTLGAERLRLADGDAALAMMPGQPVRHADRLSLEAALEQLPPGAKRVFVLHDVEGYKHTEIADLLEISVGTSKAQLHRARMLMRKRL